MHLFTCLFITTVAALLYVCYIIIRWFYIYKFLLSYGNMEILHNNINFNYTIIQIYYCHAFTCRVSIIAVIVIYQYLIVAKPGFPGPLYPGLDCLATVDDDFACVSLMKSMLVENN